MPVPRHFSQRPRRGLRPPPHRNQAPEEVPVEEVPVEAPTAEAVADFNIDDILGETAPAAESPAESLEPPPADKPAWSMLMKKSELLAIASGFGITVPDEATKAQIIALLEAHPAQ